MADERTQRYVIGGAAALIGLAAVGSLRLLGVHVVGVEYERYATAQARAKVTVHNYTESANAFILRGYAVRNDILDAVARPPFGWSVLADPLQQFNRVVGAHTYAGTPGVTYPQGLVQGHWFANDDIIASGSGPLNPALAKAERNISVVVDRGKSSTVVAYTADPFTSPPRTSPGALRNFWVIFHSSGQGSPLDVYLDPRPSMPTIIGGGTGGGSYPAL